MLTLSFHNERDFLHIWGGGGFGERYFHRKKRMLYWYSHLFIHRKNAGEFLFVDKLKKNGLKLMTENRALLFYISAFFAEWLGIFESIREAIFLFCAPWEQVKSLGSIDY